MHEMLEPAPVRVLFVDDEENILKSLARLFMDEDFEVITASSARDGLRILMETEDVGVIVSDQRMPEITGVQFLGQVREMVPDALRIMLTGYADLSATMDAINRGGAFRYITKPWNDEELVQTIRDAVNQYRLVQENRRLTKIVNQQNEELKEWNANLKQRVLDQTVQIRKSNEELRCINERISSNFHGTIQAFASLIELRDKEGRNHAKNVAALAAGIAISMKLPPEEVETIKIAGMLHDIGKIGITDQFIAMDAIDQDGEGTDHYRLHPVRGQAAIDAVEDLRSVGVTIRHHHERFDGTGFPDRLAGDAIPLGARIVSIADFADRAASRSSRSGAIDHALAMVKRELETRFDSALFNHLEKQVKTLYADIKLEARMVEEEIDPRELVSGMILARNLVSGTGLLLLNAGTELDRAKIGLIRRYSLLDPPKGGIIVYRAG